MFGKKLSENDMFVDDKGEGIFGEKVKCSTWLYLNKVCTRLGYNYDSMVYNFGLKRRVVAGMQDRF